MEKHFVTFYSPGTFIAETTERPIDSWDVEKAKEMAHFIIERYNATPYGFQFITRSRGEDDLDSHISERSPMYYLGGTIFTLEEIIGRHDVHDFILIDNMKSNGWSRVLVNSNSYRTTQPLEPGDVVLDWP